MDKDQRNKVVGHLDELRDQVAQKLGHEKDVGAHVEELRELVNKPSHAEARTSASGLEKRLLAWEAEHPSLVALAKRIAHALEDSGL